MGLTLPGSQLMKMCYLIEPGDHQPVRNTLWKAGSGLNYLISQMFLFYLPHRLDTLKSISLTFSRIDFRWPHFHHPLVSKPPPTPTTPHHGMLCAHFIVLNSSCLHGPAFCLCRPETWLQKSGERIANWGDGIWRRKRGRCVPAGEVLNGELLDLRLFRDSCPFELTPCLATCARSIF